MEGLITRGLALALVGVLLGGCVTRVRPTVAISISPGSVQGVAAEKVTEARRSLAGQLSLRGYTVTRDHRGADYVLRTYYARVSQHPSIGELVEIKLEPNPMKHEPIALPPLWPKINDSISEFE